MEKPDATRTEAVRRCLTAPSAQLNECQAALRAGVRDFFVQPFGLDELCDAAARLYPAAPLPGARTRDHLSLSDTAELECNRRAVNELLAFLLLHGFSASTRARIAGATAELLENVARHAYPEEPGRFRLEARLAGRLLRIEVFDDGIGFDPVRVAASVLEPQRSGLARARSLAEEMNFWSHPGQGTRVVLEFLSSSLVFADDRGVDLSDLDYLDPALARRVLLSLRDGEIEPQFHFSPALAVCVGRLLSAPRSANALADQARRSA
jgi:anti-sigma regulatory factor (Ser/Thr protein kinase)